VLPLVFKSVAVFPYAYCHHHYAIVKNEDKEFNAFNWIMMFLCIDFGYYWFHRFAHEWNFFWGVHITHHNSEDYNLTTALRQSAFQTFFSWMWYLPFSFFF